MTHMLPTSVQKEIRRDLVKKDYGLVIMFILLAPQPVSDPARCIVNE